MLVPFSNVILGVQEDNARPLVRLSDGDVSVGAELLNRLPEFLCDV